MENYRNNNATDAIEQLPLSVCIMFHKGDAHFLEGCINALPDGAEICLMENVKTSDIVKIGFDDYGTTQSERNVLKKARNTVYEKNFSFASCRNKNIEMATRDWILFIDPDETLWFTEHFGHVFSMPGNIGAASVTVLCHDIIPGRGLLHRDANHQYRLFRNRKGFRFEGAVHEQILGDIVSKGYDVVDTPIIIRHDGYMTDSIETVQKKLMRNVQLLYGVLHKNPEDFYSCERLSSHLFDLIQSNYFKDKDSFQIAPAEISNIKEVYNVLSAYPNNEGLVPVVWSHLMYLQDIGKFKMEITNG